MAQLEALIADRLRRRFVRLLGRGTTALYVTLRALALRDGPGEVILPDIICSNVLDAVLLAGFTPVFADVTRDRFATDPRSVRQQITPATRAIIAAHLFGFATAIPDYGVPVIEDAVQGLGGSVNGASVGTLGNISFVSFNETKMIGGQGGAILTDDDLLSEIIQQVSLDEPHPLPPSLFAERGNWSTATGVGGAVNRYNSYLHQLSTIRDTLIRPFGDGPENNERISVGWHHLSANVSERNDKAHYLRDKLSDLPLHLPEICPGDAIWRYSFAAPNRPSASWILRHLQLAGLSGSNLYPSLSAIFAPDSTLVSHSFAPNIVNLWIDSSTDYAQLDRAIAIIRATPRLGALP